jgi:hypothetical protein
MLSDDQTIIMNDVRQMTHRAGILEYENEIILQMFHDDALLILAR